VGEIKRHYRDRTWAVHVPRDLLELALRVECVRRARDVSRARRTASLERRRGDDDAATIGEGFGAEEPGFEAAEHRAMLESLMRGLSPRDREVIRLRFHEDLTQEQIGLRMQVSQMPVSRVLRAALARLEGVVASMA
jgi:RNA polymerase sigma-B factor